MITNKEWAQLFKAITSMGKYNINDNLHIRLDNVLSLLVTYCESDIKVEIENKDQNTLISYKSINNG